MDRERDRPDAPPGCSEPGCGDDAAFFVYDAEPGDWRPVCDSHARRLHPSLEVGAWLESGYMRPVEVGPPDGPPSDPRGGRAKAFRGEIEETMGWSE